MDTELVGFVTLAALILGLFAWLRLDVRQLRQEMSAQRGEMNGRIDALRDERKAQRVETGGRIDEVNGRIDALRDETGELRERVARIEGLLEAVFMRRDLTPLPDPAPSEPVRKSEAA